MTTVMIPYKRKKKLVTPDERNALIAMLDIRGVAAVLRAIDGYCGAKASRARTDKERGRWYYVGREVAKAERLVDDDGA